MFKKLLIGAGVLTAVSVLIFGRTAFSHVKHAFNWARDGVKDSMPIEYQLEQAEQTIDDIIPEIEASKQVVAQEQVEIRYLNDEIAKLEKTQATDGERIQSRNSALKSGRAELVVAGRPYQRNAVENEIRLALKKHQNNHALLESKRRLLAAREKSLQAAQHKLESVVSEKENLAIAVEQLRAQFRETQALEATSNKVHIDDSKLADVKDVLARVKKRLDVAQQLIENDGGAVIELPVEATATDVSIEVERYFAGRIERTSGACTAPAGVLASKD